MPLKSAASHVMASVLALLFAPLVKKIWLEIIDEKNIVKAIKSASTVVSEHPYIPYGNDTIALLGTIVVVFILVSIHGILYHVVRHG